MHHSQEYFAYLRYSIRYVRMSGVANDKATMVNVEVDWACQAGLIQECTEPPPPTDSSRPR